MSQNQPLPEGLEQAPEWARTLFSSLNDKISALPVTIAAEVEVKMRGLYGAPEIIKALPDKVEALKVDYELTKTELLNRIVFLEQEMDQMSIDSRSAAELLVFMDNRHDISEGRQRRINIRLCSVPEGIEGQGRGAARELAQTIINGGVGIGGQVVDRAHRQTGQPPRLPPLQPRDIVVRCSNEGVAE